MTTYDSYFLICVQESNLQWNSWIRKMIDHLKGSIKFKLNFKNKFKSI